MPVIFTTEPFTVATTGLASSALVRRRDVAHLRGRQRVEDVGQPAAVDGLRAASRRPTGRRRARAVDRLHQRGLAHLAGHHGNGELASGEATIQATSSTEAAETTAPATESTILAGSQVTRVRSARPAAPARICPSSAAARTTTSAANTRVTLEPSIRSATGPGQLRAEHRPAEETEDRGGRDQQPLPEPGERESQRDDDQHHVDEGHRAQPLTVIVPNWPSWVWKLHSKR